MLCYLHFQIRTRASGVQTKTRAGLSGLIQHFSQYDSALLFVNNTSYLMGLQDAVSYCVNSVILFLSFFSKRIEHHKNDCGY